MSDQEICRRHFRQLGFKGRYKKKVVPFINYEFDLFEKGNEYIAVYVVRPEDSFSSLVDASTIINALNGKYKVCLCLPIGFSILSNDQAKALSADISLYYLERGRIILLAGGPNKKAIERSNILEVVSTLTNINRICKLKWGFTLFKINQKLISKLSPVACSEKDFIYQIASISSIIEAIDIKGIKAIIQPTTGREKEVFEKSQSISIIELILTKYIGQYDESVITILRELRSLRNIPPIHPASTFKSVCRKYISKIPGDDHEWSELSEIAFHKFKGALVVLRDILK